MEEASAGGFPYVELLPLGVGKGVRLVFEVTHLPADVATQARTLLRLQKSRKPHLEVVTVTPTCEYIGPLHIGDAKALGRKLGALRAAEPIVA